MPIFQCSQATREALVRIDGAVCDLHGAGPIVRASDYEALVQQLAALRAQAATDAQWLTQLREQVEQLTRERDEALVKCYQPPTTALSMTVDRLSADLYAQRETSDDLVTSLAWVLQHLNDRAERLYSIELAEIRGLVARVEAQQRSLNQESNAGDLSCHGT